MPRVLLTGTMDPAGERLIAEAAGWCSPRCPPRHAAPLDRRRRRAGGALGAARRLAGSCAAPDRHRAPGRGRRHDPRWPPPMRAACRWPTCLAQPPRRGRARDGLALAAAPAHAGAGRAPAIRGGWEASRALADGAAELHGAVLGIVGVGEIGTRIAEIAHHGYGMRVLGLTAPLRRAAALRRRRGARRLLCAQRRGGAGLPAHRHARPARRARRLALLPRHARCWSTSHAARWSTRRRGGGAARTAFWSARRRCVRHQPLPRACALQPRHNVLLTPRRRADAARACTMRA